MIKRHLLILYVCLSALILGTGLQISGVAINAWFVKDINNSSTAVPKVIGLWKRCHKESILEANDAGLPCGNDNKVFRFKTHDFGK